MDLILASASPRRAELLAAAGIPFRVQPVEIDEAPHPGELPEAYVERVALDKARALVCRDPGTLILAADTTVVAGGQILGKPADDAEASRMLEVLSGRDHEVLTGVALRRGEKTITHVERSWVRFLQLTPAEVAWYVSTGEPRDKAGAYAIQGLASRFVEHITGSYSNVVGLPVAQVYQLLCRLGGVPGFAQGRDDGREGRPGA